MKKMDGQRINQNIFYSILSVAIIMGLSFVYELGKPDCVHAQSCLTVLPRFVYGSSSGTSGGGCSTPGTSASVNAPGTGVPYVVLTGWDLQYTSNDHKVDRLEVFLGRPSTGNPVIFSILACLNDRNDDDNFRWRVDYLVVRWP